MTAFFNRHSDKIKGIFSCIDRLIIQGTFPEICYPGAITTFFYMHGIRIFDFKKWAAPMRDQINENAKQIAKKNNIKIQFIRKNNFRKEKRVKEIISQRGDHRGIVHIFSAMETCTAYKPWHDKKSHKTFFKYDSGRCLHYYKSYKYYLTSLGRQITATSLKLKEMYVIPVLRGELVIS